MNIPLKCAIIRDTHKNIKRSVTPVFDEFFAIYPNIRHQWRHEQEELTIFTYPEIHIDLFGIDDINALTKLQGAAYALIWPDDPVPYTDSERTNAGISEDTFNACLVRCARQAGMRNGLKPRLQITTNLPDDDHWFNRRLLEPPDGPIRPDTPDITKRVFEIPYGENVYLSDLSRQATRAAYADDEVAYERFVLGKVATRYAGKRVTENFFNPNSHIARDALAPMPGWPGWISFDSWGNPAAVIGQQAPNGRLYVLDVAQGAADIRGLIQDYIKPLLNSPRWRYFTNTNKWRSKCPSWRIMGDCTMRQPDQSDVESSAALVVEEAFPDEYTGKTPAFEPGPGGPQSWPLIRSGLLQTLRWTIESHAALILCPVNTRVLIAGLRGRWHYPVNRSGVVTSRTPAKNHHSHPCDALANACCVLHAWNIPQRRWGQKNQESREKSRKRANSYAA